MDLCGAQVAAHMLGLSAAWLLCPGGEGKRLRPLRCSLPVRHLVLFWFPLSGVPTEQGHVRSKGCASPGIAFFFFSFLFFRKTTCQKPKVSGLERWFILIQ